MGGEDKVEFSVLESYYWAQEIYNVDWVAESFLSDIQSCITSDGFVSAHCYCTQLVLDYMCDDLLQDDTTDDDEYHYGDDDEDDEYSEDYDEDYNVSFEDFADTWYTID